MAGTKGVIVAAHRADLLLQLSVRPWLVFAAASEVLLSERCPQVRHCLMDTIDTLRN